jgi:hypothetical protein
MRDAVVGDSALRQPRWRWRLTGAGLTNVAAVTLLSRRVRDECNEFRLRDTTCASTREHGGQRARCAPQAVDTAANQLAGKEQTKRELARGCDYP